MSLSGAFFQDSLELIRREQSLNWLNMWMVIGTEESQVVTERGSFNFLELNRIFKEELVKLEAEIEYIEKDGIHTWGFWQQELPKGLLHFFG